MNRIIRKLAACVSAGFVLSAVIPATAETDATVTLSVDRWYYPFNGTPGTRSTGSMFAYVAQPGDPVYGFNYRDGYVILKFDVELPLEFQGGDPYVIKSASLEFWDQPSANWDPLAVDIELFAAGFGPTYSEATWAGTEGFVGGGLTAPPDPRDPYPRNLDDDSHAEDDTNAVPWALGDPDDVYTGSGGLSEPFKVVFDLDVNDPTIEAELLADIASGVSSWIVCSNLELGGIGGTGFPIMYMSENGSIPSPATPASLRIVLEAEDNQAPESEVVLAPSSQYGGAIAGTLTASDTGGSGLASVALYARKNGQSWQLVPGAVSGTSFSFTPSDGPGTYFLQTVAVDGQANSETVPAGSSGNGDARVIWSDSDSAVIMGIADGGSPSVLEFPVTASLTVSLSISGLSDGDAVSLQRSMDVSGAPAELLAGDILQEKLIITGTGLPPFTATLVWNYDSASDDSMSGPITTVYQVDGGAITNTFPASLLATEITVNGITGFSEWYAGESGLPVVLDMFSVD